MKKKAQMGDYVEVTHKPNDLFNHDFVGFVQSIRNGNPVVVDGKDNAWEVDPDQVEVIE
jgi:hypothetical protein